MQLRRSGEVRGCHDVPRRRKPLCRCLSKSLSPPVLADLILTGPSGGAIRDIHVFGVDHRKMQPQIGEFILAHRPTAVIVETGQ
jgi:hypothetical protein